MPQFVVQDRSALERLRPARNCQDRQPYRDAIAGLVEGGFVEIAPEDGESIRQVKTNVTRAAHEVARAVRYGETKDGTLLVWLGAARKRPKKAA